MKAVARHHHSDVSIAGVPKIHWRLPVRVSLDDPGLPGARYIPGVLPGVWIAFRRKIYHERWIELL
jgi:hypothetical protein